MDNYYTMPEIIENIEKRPKWRDFYMDMCFFVSQKSLDPSTKHGCVVVDDDNNLLSIGFNSPPRDCYELEIPLTRPEKYLFMVHAEENSIINAARIGTSLKNSTFYITGYPCSKCFRMIVNVGAKKIIYGPINSKCVSKDDIKAIEIMNRSNTIGKTKIELEPFNSVVGNILRNCAWTTEIRLNFVK